MGVARSVFGPLFASSRTALAVLFFLSFVYFLENFDRSLISVSPIPYIDYGSYEYSVLAGPAFTIVYTLGGVIFALMSYTEQRIGGGSTKAASILKFNILSLTTLVFSVSFACTAFATYFWQQVLIRIAMGLAQSVITPFSTSIISDYFPPEMRGSAFGIFNLGTYISFSLSLSLGIWIYITYGWQAGYILFGALGVVCGVVMPILPCLTKPAKEPSREPSAEPTVSSVPSDMQERYSTHSLMHSFEERDLTPSVEGDRSSIREYIIAVAGESGTYWGYCTCHLRSMAALAYDICFVKWYNSPGIYLLCLATGVRLGAGYIWVAYTGAFFSDLFEAEEDSSCDFSYSAGYTTLPSNVCDSDYPYCVDGACSALTSFPWHNKVTVPNPVRPLIPYAMSLK
jgi:MFS family permease